MASPVDASRTPTSIATATTPLAINLPGSISAGDLLIMFIRTAGAQTLTTPAGWTALVTNNAADATDDVTGVFWRKADGTEGATVNVTPSAAAKAAAVVWRITGAADPTVTPPQVSSAVVGTAANSANPPSISPTGGSKDYLFLILGGLDGEGIAFTHSVYTNLQSANSGTAGAVATNCIIAGATRQATTATEDPAAFTHTVPSTGCTAFTIAVHPPPVPKQTNVARMSLAGASTPATRTSHSLKVRARVTALTGTIRIALYEGSNNRSGDLETSALTTSLADYTVAIPDANAANITSYDDLEVRVWGYSANGDAAVFEVDQVWLEIPAFSAKANGIQSQGTLGGSRLVLVAKPGGIVSPATVLGSGVRAITVSKTGGMASPASVLGAGVSAISFVKTGGIKSTGTLLGAGAAGAGVTKTGGIFSPALAGGARSVQFAKTAGDFSPGTVGASRLIRAAKQNGVVSQSTVGAGKKTSSAGPWSETWNFTVTTVTARTAGIISTGGLGGAKSVLTLVVKTGGPVSAVLIGGSRAIRSARVGGTLSTGSLGASRAVVAVQTGGIKGVGLYGGSQGAATFVAKTGGPRVIAILGGSKSVTTAAVKTGGIFSPVKLGGTRFFTVGRTGGIFSPAKLGGTKIVSMVKTGGAISTITLGASKVFSTIKTGGIFAAGKFGGTQGAASTFSRSGGIFVVSRLGGTKATATVKAGGVFSACALGGSKAFRVARTVGYLSAGQLGGSETRRYVKTSGISSTARIAGYKLAFFVVVGIISPARIGGSVTTSQTITDGARGMLLGAEIAGAVLAGTEIPEGVMPGAEIVESRTTSAGV
jgi:hypothetical protein